MIGEFRFASVDAEFDRSDGVSDAVNGLISHDILAVGFLGEALVIARRPDGLARINY